MKKVFLVLISVMTLCGFSELAQQGSGPEVIANTSKWEVQMRGNSSVRAFNQDHQVEVIVNFPDVLPNSPLCLSNKRIKDIKMTLDIHKVAAAGESNWEKSFEKTKMRFSGRKGSEERKVYGSMLIKNNLKFEAGTVVNVGTLEFLAPFTCDDFFPIRMIVTGMKVQGRELPSLDFTIKNS